MSNYTQIDIKHMKVEITKDNIFDLYLFFLDRKNDTYKDGYFCCTTALKNLKKYLDETKD